MVMAIWTKQGHMPWDYFPVLYGTYTLYYYYVSYAFTLLGHSLLSEASNVTCRCHTWLLFRYLDKAGHIS
jgi:hypothetical protein